MVRLLPEVSDRVVAFGRKIDLVDFENLAGIEDLVDTEGLVVDLNTEV